MLVQEQIASENVMFLKTKLEAEKIKWEADRAADKERWQADNDFKLKLQRLQLIQSGLAQGYTPDAIKNLLDLLEF